MATVRGVTGPAVDGLSALYLGARLGQSIVHVAPGGESRGNQRFAFPVVQLVYLLALAVLAAA